MGWDEYANAAVGKESLRAYTGAEAYSDFLGRENLGHHGPSYFMVYALLSEGLASLIPSWQRADGRHFVNYLTFLLAGAGLYLLCLRVLPKRVALWTTAFFLTQPLLFGHGFINQKDMPFMAFFLATVVAGLAGADRLGEAARGSPAPGLRSSLRQDLHSPGSAWRLAFGLWLVLFLWFVLDLLILGEILAVLKSVITLAHTGQAWELINRLYEVLAEDSHKTGVAVYHAKVEMAYYLVGRAWLILLALAAGVAISRRGFPRVGRAVFPGRWQAYSLLLLAAGLLGFTVSIRPLGGFAGLLVAGYMIYRLRWAAAGPLLIFAGIAGLATYITWPWLWPAPIERLLQSLGYLADFEEHKQVLFGGRLYPSEAMPWGYLPVLLTIRLTEPVIPLFLVGLGVAWVDGRKHPEHRAVLLLVLTWLLAISGLDMLPGSVHYDNFRHVLFVLPALFVFIGFGMKLLSDKVNSGLLRGLLFGALLLPGIMGIVHLHPYEYVHYNALVGGIDGAEGRFDLDYWCTSYREAMAYVNDVAEPGDSVMAMEPAQPARSFARGDLEVERNDGDLSVAGIDFLLTCDQWLGQDWADPELRLVHRVGIGGATFAEVFERISPELPAPWEDDEDPATE